MCVYMASAQIPRLDAYTWHYRRACACTCAQVQIYIYIYANRGLELLKGSIKTLLLALV